MYYYHYLSSLRCSHGEGEIISCILKMMLLVVLMLLLCGYVYPLSSSSSSSTSTDTSLTPSPKYDERLLLLFFSLVRSLACLAAKGNFVDQLYLVSTRTSRQNDIFTEVGRDRDPSYRRSHRQIVIEVYFPINKYIVLPIDRRV